ncbi:MAG: hypothetical protein A3F40_03105 [Chlamydiae bacterium RIFCSPHIGHO2_12_FULL_27_8]|nr:MAG: hypothetical protein A3F40_03105 [Chlamydiae bacterium RIFCSPHIGHO2_12_FULL_27_8]
MKKYFITGLVILLPLTLTVLIVFFVLNFLTKPFMGIITKIFSTINLGKFHTQIFSHEQIVKFASQIIIVIGIVILTIILGVLARWFIFKWLIKTSDRILHKIPLINKVYKTTQDIVKTIFVTDKNSFKQVVMVPFPHKGIYCIGLVSRGAPSTCSKSANEELISVFVPTTPNPTTGFLLLYKKEDLVYTDMHTEDAVKYIVSCGVIIPETKEENKK